MTGGVRATAGRHALAACLLVLGLSALVTGCADPAAAARGSCRAQDVGELRCRAIVADASARMARGAPPVVGVDVRMATAADRVTLRSQQLVAVVRFAFLDGSAQEVEVFCAPRSARTALCVEPAR